MPSFKNWVGGVRRNVSFAGKAYALGGAGAFALVVAMPWAARAEIRPDRIHPADLKVTDEFVYDGLITGGDKAINDVVVKNIRRAPNAGFERIVLDLEATRAGDMPAIQRPPYYQIAVTPDQKQVVFTVFGKPRLEFDAKQVAAAFKKSRMVEKVLLFPRLDEESWTFVLELKHGRAVRAFELSNPVRVIVDIRESKLKG